MILTVETLERLAMDGNMLSIVLESCQHIGEYELEYEEKYITKFHINSKVIFTGCNDVAPFSMIPKLQNIFEEAYQGFHLEIDSVGQSWCIFTVKENEIKSLEISKDYKLALEKLSEIKEVRGLVEEAMNVQKDLATRINDLSKKLKDVKDYAKNLQLKEENEKKVSEQLNNINSDIQELEIRLKKDIPELDKSLDINNFR